MAPPPSTRAPVPPTPAEVWSTNRSFVPRDSAANTPLTMQSGVPGSSTGSQPLPAHSTSAPSPPNTWSPPLSPLARSSPKPAGCRCRSRRGSGHRHPRRSRCAAWCSWCPNRGTRRRRRRAAGRPACAAVQNLFSVIDPGVPAVAQQGSVVAKENVIGRSRGTRSPRAGGVSERSWVPRRGSRRCRRLR